ncbi:MAG: amino acid/amide transporter substrate-binding protein family [Rhizobacter sp.]|nr:amino acid/amide transporter substrate-binding protein family [Rhizobacter sp.]
MKLTSQILAILLATAAGQALADISVGVSLPLTGPGSGLGIPVKNYIALWPQTVAGQKLNVIVLDDATDPTNGVRNAKRFVTDDKVDVIMGSVNTPVALPMAAVAAESGTPQLAFSPIPLAEGKDRWTFRMPQANTIMAAAVVRHMKAHGVKTVGFLAYSDSYGEVWIKDLGDAAAREGLKIGAIERFARGDSSVTAQALKLVAANPDAILVVASGSGAAMPQQGLVERGYKGKIYQTHAAATRDLIRLGGKDVEGGYVVSSPVVVAEKLPMSNPSREQGMLVTQKYEKVYGVGSLNPAAAHAHDAILVLEKAVPMALAKAAPGTPEFRSALRDAFEQMGVMNLSHGVLTWTPTDHWGYNENTGVILKVVNGDWQVE